MAGFDPIIPQEITEIELKHPPMPNKSQVHISCAKWNVHISLSALWGDSVVQEYNTRKRNSKWEHEEKGKAYGK